jgi:tetratricopeptide (TPR) repeat protein
MQDAAYFNLAQLSSVKCHWDEALDTVNRSMIRNWHNHKARHLKVAVLRKLNRNDEALKLADESLELDAFNLGVAFEKYLLSNAKEDLNLLLKLADTIHDFIEFSLDYAMAGMFGEAQQLLLTGIKQSREVYPMAWYFMGWFELNTPYSGEQFTGISGDSEAALNYFKKAAQVNPSFCFPNKPEEVVALQCAIKVNPADAKAPYYLGNFWYNARQYDEAISCWEISRNLDGDFPTVRRNLALAYYNKTNEPVKALTELETAFKLDTSDARVLMELDQLYKKLNRPHADRLALLENHLDSVDYRDDLYLERATLYNQLGNFEKALELLMKRNFHPWEGGEGKVTGQFLFAHIELAKKALHDGELEKAISHLQATEMYPHNLGEGKLTGTRENDIHYWLGCIYEAKGDMETARKYWEKATEGSSEPTAAIFYNDQHPDKIYYQGLALLKLNRKEEADDRFSRLKRYGETHLNDHIKVDYFAVSLPDLLIWDEDLDRRNEINSRYLMGLGLLGMGQTEQANKQLKTVLEMDINHQGARQQVNVIPAF